MAFTTKSQPLYYSLSLLSILQILFVWPSEGTASGFTTRLIPRDSPLSPFYNPSNTYFDRLHDAFERSLQRVNHFKSSLDPTSEFQTPIKPGPGEYFISVSIGTPPQKVIGIADTGSDLIWTQCLPCHECYNQTLPLFNPQHSSTYQHVSCQSTFCNALPSPNCSSDGNSDCEYSYSYGDGSHTNGDLANDTLTLGSARLPKIVFGCGHDNGGTFSRTVSGIVGLGGGELSLVSQLRNSISKKFSYCLVPRSTGSGKISFGSDAVVSGPNVATTPLVSQSPDTYYYLTLEAVSVGNQSVAYKGSSPNDDPIYEGNIIIDSGTTLTLLPSDLFNGLVSALEQAISARKVDDPQGILSLCYSTASGNIDIPTITAHFTGADVQLQPVNTFALVADDVLCLTMIPASDIAIFGNIAQKNFLIGYDLEAGTVSFKPTDCTKQ